MHAGRHYSIREIAVWTRRESAVFLLLSLIPTALYSIGGYHWLAMPWLPIAMIGTTVAFITGFKNNASYSRLWEARHIWGSIVNISRQWAMLVLSHFPDDSSRKRFIWRHFAWLTALRYQLREARAWEQTDRAQNLEFKNLYKVAEWSEPLHLELAPLLSPAELSLVLSRKNHAIHLLVLQSEDLARSIGSGEIAELRRIEMQALISALVDAQGKCERIKNFPFPRQLATLNLLFVWLFILLVPFGLLQEFQKLGANLVWCTVPASMIVSWVFHTMDKIGDSSENPFEGSPNDVPITAMSRNIEIDLREMLGDCSVPPALQPQNNILM